MGPWLVVMALLLRFEVFPEFFTHTLPGYRSLLAGDVLLQESWARILVEGKPIGYSHTSVEVDETDPLKHFTMINRVNARLKALGFDQPVFVETRAHIDVMQHLQSFAFSLSSRHYEMQIRGRRTEGTRYAVTVRGGAGVQKHTVEIPDDVILYSPMTEMALKKLRPGTELRFRTFDPVSMKPAQVLIQAIRDEAIDIDGVSVPATLLSSEYQGMTVQSWVDASGRLLRQETPMGWTIESCSPEAAIQALRESGKSDDIGISLAVPVDGRITNPTERGWVRLRLTGVEWKPGQLTTNRQRPEADAGDVLELVVQRARWPAHADAQPLAPEARAAALESTPFIQSDAPEIRAQAEQIVNGARDDREKALAILRWVHKSVRKEGAMSLPSALDVLRTRVGDCNEHTYLYTALARAAGLPSKVMVGLAYHEGRFHYHAWPAVHVGDWVELDPTWGQELVDATHIRITEGELAQQMQIIHVVGRLRIAVLDPS